MRILSLSHTFPYPPDDGSRVRVWNMARALGARHEVHLLTSGLGEHATIPEVPGVRVEVMPASLDTGIAARGVRWGEALLRGTPPATLAGRSPALVTRAQEIVDGGWPDVVVAEENASGVDLMSIRGRLPRVWVKHSVQAVDAEEAATASSGIKTSLGRWLAARYERRGIAVADLVVALTDDDRATLRDRYDVRTIEVVPNGVDTSSFPFRGDPATTVVAFVASYEWGANVDAARWVVSEVWPRVAAEVPGARLRLIGKGLGDALASELRGAGVEAVGYVLDVAEALSDVSVSIVPVRAGTGIRCKLQESLSLGIATVTTSLGRQGVPVENGRDCLIADDRDAFADGVIRLLREPALRARLGASGRRVVESMSWDRSAQAFERALKAQIADRAGRA